MNRNLVQFIIEEQAGGASSTGRERIVAYHKGA